MNLRKNRESRQGEDFHLKVAKKHVDLLNSVPEFRDLSTEQLRQLVEKSYTHGRTILKAVPPVGEFFEVRDHVHEEENKMARAVMIGILATEEQIASTVSIQFLERAFVFEK